MLKLYLLSIIYFLCAVKLSTPHMRELVGKPPTMTRKEKREKRVNKLAMALMPIFNIIMGTFLLVAITGKFDDKIKEELDK